MAFFLINRILGSKEMNMSALKKKYEIIPTYF